LSVAQAYVTVDDEDGPLGEAVQAGVRKVVADAVGVGHPTVDVAYRTDGDRRPPERRSASTASRR